MSALFDFNKLLLVILLMICTSTYIRSVFPSMIDRNKEGITGVVWKAARIGERLSPYVSIWCFVMAISTFLS
ncbi:hypothetical protein DFH27DRAFT_584303 [Peziza echinospora]|nr:hypothetical protein DFH27DRAFT_584303 [Peziza echinospora]